MKVLFAVSSESISDAIIKRYQKEYKEILSYKNVYYFNAILKEIQKDKTYDRIIISEDLEPSASNNYDAIDKNIFEKLDTISDEAEDSEGNDTSIILICTDRHTPGCQFLVKIFGIGIYNALLGNDRSMDQVCKLIAKPRVKREAKMYYRIDADDVKYDPQNEGEVNEAEIQSILSHYKKIARQPEKFADDFANIASQYSDEQLKIIINCLPMNVKAVLEQESPKYQEIMSVNGVVQKISNTTQAETDRNLTGIKIDLLDNLDKKPMSGPVIIPSSVKTSKTKSPQIAQKPTANNVEVKPPQRKTVVRKAVDKLDEETPVQPKANNVVEEIEDVIEDTPVTPPVENKKPESQRPVTARPMATKPAQPDDGRTIIPKPRNPEPVEDTTGKRGRPKKVVNQPEEELTEDDLLLPGFGATPEDLPGMDDVSDVDDLIPGVGAEEVAEDTTVPEVDDEVIPEVETEVEAEDDLIPGVDDEVAADDDLIPGVDDEVAADDDLIPGVDDEVAADDDLIPGVDDEVAADDDLIPGVDDEVAADDDLIQGVDDEVAADDDLIPGLDDEVVEDTVEVPEVAETDDDIIPGLDDDEVVEDTVEVPEVAETDDDVIPGLDDDEVVEDTVEVPEVAEADDDLIPGLDDDEVVEDIAEVPEVAETDDDLIPGLDDEDIVEDETVLPNVEDEATDDSDTDDDLIIGLDDEDVSGADVELPDIDEEVTDVADETDDLIPGLDDDTVVEDVAEDVTAPKVEDEVVEEVPAADEDEYEAEAMDIPGIDDLDDLDDLTDLSNLGGDDEAVEEVVEEAPEEVEEVGTEEAVVPGIDELDDLDSIPGLDDDFSLDDLSSPDLGSDVATNELDEDSLLVGVDETAAPEPQPINQTQSTAVESIQPQVDYSMSSLNSLLTKEKKIVTFVGTTKNGTSFLVNYLGNYFSQTGLNTAILDMTKNRNSYYLYTKNDDNLRNVAFSSIEKLKNGFAEGIQVNKNLTVYTAKPGDEGDFSNAEPILSTLVQNHSLVLIDCDFTTPEAYFASCQEIYLVQSLDVLTIQPLTAFLRDLKSKGVLEPEKIRVVINKEVKLKSVTTKAIVGGMSTYNDPGMSFMTELFNKDTVKYCAIPFEEEAYAKYLDSMISCEMTINYSRNMTQQLKLLSGMVYPVTSAGQSYGPGVSVASEQNYNKNTFSSSMNNTLNKMKNKNKF